MALLHLHRGSFSESTKRSLACRPRLGVCLHKEKRTHGCDQRERGASFPNCFHTTFNNGWSSLAFKGVQLLLLQLWALSMCKMYGFQRWLRYVSLCNFWSSTAATSTPWKRQPHLVGYWVYWLLFLNLANPPQPYKSTNHGHWSYSHLCTISLLCSLDLVEKIERTRSATNKVLTWHRPSSKFMAKELTPSKSGEKNTMVFMASKWSH